MSISFRFRPVFLLLGSLLFTAAAWAEGEPAIDSSKELPVRIIPDIPAAAEAYYGPDDYHLIVQTQDPDAQKAPGSAVAGQATVFVFPDLNTGNTTYKAVQRSANVVSVGPMLQGLRKPVNDLSRGALVDDIVFTIALTVIQAESMAQR